MGTFRNKCWRWYWVVGCLLSLGVASDNSEGLTPIHLKDNGTVTHSHPHNRSIPVSGGTVLRVEVDSKNATTEMPILIVARELRSILSWTIPLQLTDLKVMGSARTLCPYPMTHNGTVSVEFSTSSMDELEFSLDITEVPQEDFNVPLQKKVRLAASPSDPYFVKFTMPKDMDSVVVEVQGSDDICMVVSVQPISCPVYDLDTNVQFAGTYQTMTRQAAIPIVRRKFEEFYIVFVVKPNPFECTGMSNIMPTNPVSQDIDRKAFELNVRETLSDNDFNIAVGVTGAVVAGIYLIAIVISCVFAKIDEKERTDNEARLFGNEEDREPYESLPTSADTPTSSLGYGALDHSVSSNLAGSRRPNSLRNSRASSQQSLNTGESINGNVPGREVVEEAEEEGEETEPLLTESDKILADEYDTLDDARVEKSVLRAKANLKVRDLAMKPWKGRDKKYRIYQWNLLTISIFYALPVIQLVLAYQNAVVTSGNLDICYYNFLCAHPSLYLFAFNNVFSNIGYVMLGILFLILVRNRELFHRKQMEQNPRLETEYGLPRHYGLFYAMGISLVMEGVLSGCYHVCPNYSNFQFDTAFMYMIGALGMLKIYQTRHPDINANSHISYAVMAFVILISVIGVVWNGLAFWIVFSICYLLLLIALSAEFYYKGQWHLDRGFWQRLQQDWRASFGRNWYRPSYPDRAVFLIIGNMLNIAFCVLGLVNQPKDFGSFMLAIFIANLLLYTIFYIAMKIRYSERLRLRPVLYISLSLVTWSAALFFFFRTNSDWTLSPALSREKNEDCLLLKFYDSHDIWHFLSALSLFLSFLILLNIDDDLDYVHQSQIAVF